MTIGWMTALKVIPWGDVIDAAPGIVKAARKMFSPSQQTLAPAERSDLLPAGPAELQERIAQLETGLAELAAQQRASGQLIESLAEQNAKVVQMIEMLRLRTRLLLGLSAVLALAVLGMLTWLAR